MKKISVVINTLNEEENIKTAISSVLSIANEIIVVDMHSSDDTVRIAKELGAEVFTHKKTGYVEPARNYAISKTKNEWILILDADEQVPGTLQNLLNEILESAACDYYRIPRKNIIFGKWIKHARWWPDYNIRFFKKGNVAWDDEIHSIPITKGTGADIEAKEENALIHYHYNTIEQYLTRLNRYTTIQAENLKLKNVIFEWQNVIIKPTQEFASRFYFGKGYKDGLHGLMLALLQAFSEIVVQAKLWQLNNFQSKTLTEKDFVSQFRKSKRELSYWEADTILQENSSVIEKLRRKVKL